MRSKDIVLAGVATALVFVAAQASAAVELVKTSTKAKGATTITWSSSFADFDYSLGDPISMTVSWTVDAGAAEYVGFDARPKYTPRSRKDPAAGSVPAFELLTENSARLTFQFSGLHLDRRRQVDIGNGHFKLYLKIDKDG
ncbi:MAG: hypothetical protein ACE5D3_00080, partial [Candidatus Binatia bacterium]